MAETEMFVRDGELGFRFGLPEFGSGVVVVVGELLDLCVGVIDWASGTSVQVR